MFDGAEGQCIYQGEHFCLPWGTDTYALFWNKDLFEDAGLDPEQPPQTLEELAEYAQKLTITEDDGSISQVGFIPDFSWSHLDQYTAMMDGWWYNEDGTEVTLTSDAVVDALLWQQQFYCDYDPEEVLGKAPFDLMTPEEAQGAANFFRSASRVGQSFSGLECSYLHKNGSRVVIETSGTPIFDDEGKPLG